MKKYLQKNAFFLITKYPKRGGDIDNEKVFYESKDLTKELFEKSKDYLVPKIGNSTVLELNELFRFYKYEKGYYFKYIKTVILFAMIKKAVILLF